MKTELQKCFTEGVTASIAKREADEARAPKPPEPGVLIAASVTDRVDAKAAACWERETFTLTSLICLARECALIGATTASRPQLITAEEFDEQEEPEELTPQQERERDEHERDNWLGRDTFALVVGLLFALSASATTAMARGVTVVAEKSTGWPHGWGWIVGAGVAWVIGNVIYQLIQDQRRHQRSLKILRQACADAEAREQGAKARANKIATMIVKNGGHQ